VRLLLAALVLLGAAAGAAAQTATLEATILDAETGTPLPGATAQVMGTIRGASADGEGRLRLDLPALPDTVLVRYVGYAPAQIVIAAADARDGRVVRTIRLSPSALSLGVVTVTAEEPGEVLWRRVLARKAALRARVGTYYAEGVTRLLLRRDGPLDVRPVPIRLEESLSNLSWTASGGLREEVVARRRRPEGAPFRWARLGPVPDLFFEDDLPLDGRSVPSPTHPRALDFYEFRLGETVEAGGRRYLDVAVIPRSGGLVAGSIRVVDSLFVIASADLRADPGPQGAPVTDFEASYRWTFSPATGDALLRDSLWMPATFEREGFVTVGMPGMRVPTVRFRQRSALTLRAPRVYVAAETNGLRYRNRRDVYKGADAFRAARFDLRLDALEVAADTLGRLREATLRELLPPQSFTFSMGIPGFNRAIGMDLDGQDDD
jgi:hypothetical protein